MRDEHRAELRELLDAAGFDADPTEFTRYGSARKLLQLPRRQPPRLLTRAIFRRPHDHAHPRAARIRDVRTATSSTRFQRAAETGIYDIRGWGANESSPLRRPLFWAHRCPANPLEGYRERVTPTSCSVTATRSTQQPRIPITIAGMSFGALSGRAKEALGRGASEVGTSTRPGRRHDDRGAGQSKHLVYQYLPSPVRHEPRRPAQGRCDRDRAGPGRQARRWRNGCGPEDHRPVSRDAYVARGRRPAQRVPTPDWTGPGRPRHPRSSNCARSPGGRSRST